MLLDTLLELSDKAICIVVSYMLHILFNSIPVNSKDLHPPSKYCTQGGMTACPLSSQLNSTVVEVPSVILPVFTQSDPDVELVDPWTPHHPA